MTDPVINNSRPSSVDRYLSDSERIQHTAHAVRQLCATRRVYCLACLLRLYPCKLFPRSF